MCVVSYTHENSVIGSPWNSIWQPSGLESFVMTTELYYIFWRRSLFEHHGWTWVIYINNVLLIKTILFDILEFWCQLEEIRFVKTLSKRCMFVSFMKNFSVLITTPLDQIQQNLLRKETCQTTVKPADIILETWFEEYPTPPSFEVRSNFVRSSWGSLTN